jgi:hypothetical protein
MKSTEVEKRFPLWSKVELLENYFSVPKGSIGEVTGYMGYKDGSSLVEVNWGFRINNNPGFDPEVLKLVRNEDNNFCSCKSPNIVKNSVLGKIFNFCRSCKKEKE